MMVAEWTWRPSLQTTAPWQVGSPVRGRVEGAWRDPEAACSLSPLVASTGTGSFYMGVGTGPPPPSLPLGDTGLRSGSPAAPRLSPSPCPPSQAARPSSTSATRTRARTTATARSGGAASAATVLWALAAETVGSVSGGLGGAGGLRPAFLLRGPVTSPLPPPQPWPTPTVSTATAP